MFCKSHRVRFAGILVTTVLLFIQGCSGSSDFKVPARKGPTKIGSQQEGKVAASANNRMAFRLFAEITKEDENANIFFSPFSISHGIGMTLLGADGETESQIKSALQVPEKYDTLKYCQGVAYIGSLVNPKKKTSSKTMCYVANSLWAEEAYPFNKTFLRSLQEYYGAGTAFSADFRNQPSKECERINRWVSTYTGSKIPNAISPDAINDLTRLILVNAIYFRGNWLEPFDGNSTYRQDFHLSSTDKTDVLIMWGCLSKSRYAAFHADGRYFDTPDTILVSGDVDIPPELESKKVPVTQESIEKAKRPRYPEDDGFQVVELSYEDERLSMVLIAPLSPDGLPRLEKILTADRFEQWVGKLRQRKTEVHLPKFKLATDYSLVGSLESLGMKNAFQMPSIDFDPKTEADFSRMTQAGKPDLFVSAVIHKAVIEVQEKGTEAAVVTIVEDEVAAASPMEFYTETSFIPVFNANRPFLFFICDRKLHTILFAGRVKRP